MSFLFVDGAEQYGDNVDIQRAWSPITGAGTATVDSPGRGGVGQCLGGGFSTVIGRNIFMSGSTLVVGAAMNFQAAIGAVDLIRCMNSATEQTVLRLTAAGELAVDRGAVNLGQTSGLGLLTDQYYYIELKVLYHASAGTIDVQVDGANVLTDTGLDTIQTSNTFADSIRFVVNSVVDAQFDDIYVLDGSGGVNDDFLGDVVVETLFPDADGATNQFTRVGGGTNNYEAVDDGSTPDDDSTYNHSAVLDETELYGFAAITATVDTIHCVAVTNHVRKTDAGFRQIRQLARSVATTGEGAAQTLGVDYIYKQAIFEQDPDAAAPWTQSTVDAAQFGMTIEA